MKKALVIIACVVFSTLFFGYYKLGGFNEPEYLQADAPDYWIYGNHYKGRLEDKKFASLFEEAEKYIEENQIKGYAGAYYYNNPQQASDTAEAFVGLIVEDSLPSVPSSYNLLKLNRRKVVQANLRSHYIVSPINIYEKILEYSKEQDLAVQKSPALEIYRAEDDLIIQLPLEE